MGNWKKILLAVDGSENSRRAVIYLSHIAPLIEGVEICVLNVYPQPPPDYYTEGGRLDRYLEMRTNRAREMFKEAGEILVAAGVDKSSLDFEVHMAEDCTISEVVLKIQDEGDYGTVVAGKRGVSKAEEFLFGSISNALARHSKKFTSWIVG